MKVIITGEKVYLFLVLVLGVICILFAKNDYPIEYYNSLLLVSAGWGLLGYFFGYFFAKLGFYDRLDKWITDKIEKKW